MPFAQFLADVVTAGFRSDQLDVRVFRSREQYLSSSAERTVQERKEVERIWAQANHGDQPWYHYGVCEVCGNVTLFQLDWVHGGELPNFRERTICLRCQLNNRQRFAAALVRKIAGGLPHSPGIYCYEQTTPYFTALNELFHGTVVGSEYLGDGLGSGSVVNGIRHEDALALSFADASFDILSSNDVFEHVPSVEGAMQEACRILKPDGVMVFSIPFFSDRPTTQVRARVNPDGSITHLQEPVYHGNPISAEGSLVFHDFGWDLLDTCKAAGFRDAAVLGYYSVLYGYLGDGLQLMFVARR